MSMNHSKMLIKIYFRPYLAQETISILKATKPIKHRIEELMLATSVLEVEGQALAKKKYKVAELSTQDSIKVVTIHKISIR